ncbi:hypothetical protein Scep_005437 [Stephania cephalantha]|uniref:Uncharacterized protein n=1 Tax=Stephania cephalantha TaxID=152367 RepID=A0AAP0KUA4_9MAGN
MNFFLSPPPFYSLFPLHVSLLSLSPQRFSFSPPQFSLSTLFTFSSSMCLITLSTSPRLSSLKSHNSFQAKHF